jgi:esterase/lipase superfamily enzyme
MKNIILLLFATACLTTCVPGIKVVNEENYTDNLIRITVDSDALKGNLLGEPSEKVIYVLLPPSYEESNKKYPVVYYLHGYGGNSFEFMIFAEAVTELMASGKIEEFIIVGANGSREGPGSFYANSEVTGNWEDFFVTETVQLVDKKYRTISDRKSRGIAGFSMGGYGAINLGLKYPDIFSICYALCPGVFDENGLVNAISMWNEEIMNAYGAAFSPNPSIPDLYTEIPDFSGTEEDNIIVSNWESGFGNMKEKIDNYLDKGIYLDAIEIGYGRFDMYKWIIDGCIYFSGLLDENSIDHELVEILWGHQITLDIVSDFMLPFFSDNLEFE